MNTTGHYCANPVVSCGAEDDGAVLYNPDTDTTTVINTSGQLLWQFLAAPRTVGEMATYLVETYRDIEVAQATADAAAFVETLAPDFLIQVDDAD
ncbi:MAG: PqqD family peptide modification chaperone [Anaerolineae bacterium]|nr:PqqD family peptide modification chaperone [Anaerolineae bacterium]